MMLEVREQCKGCFHFQVCANVLKQQLFIREKIMGEEDPKCECRVPTADVVEVRHGEWIYHECVSTYEGCKSGYSCSVCDAFVNEEIFDTDEFHKNFCGNCGAKMDGERREGCRGKT